MKKLMNHKGGKHVNVVFSKHTKVVFYWEQLFLIAWVFVFYCRKITFSVGLVDQHFQQASNQFETDEKVFA